MAVVSDSSDQADPKGLGGPRGTPLAAGPRNLSLVSPCPVFYPASPSHLLWDLAALGLSFVGQPSSSPGPVPHPSEREGSPAWAWYLLPTCIPLLSPGPFYTPAPRKAQGLNWTSAEASPSAHSMPWNMLPPARGSGPWFCGSFKAQELDSSFKVLWASHFIPDQGPRSRETLCPLGEGTPRSLGSGIQHPFPTPLGQSLLLVFKERG